jgi:hypothetical protein
VAATGLGAGASARRFAPLRRLARIAQLHAQSSQLSHAAESAAHAKPSTHDDADAVPGTAGDAPWECALDPRDTRHRIRADLSLSDADYLALLGLADILQPGTYVAVAGNPAWIEEKLVPILFTSLE